MAQGTNNDAVVTCEENGVFHYADNDKVPVPEEEQRTQDAQTGNDCQRPDEILLLAATYVEDALEGRTLPYRTDPVSIAQYRIYSNPIRQWGTIFFMWWILCLAIFENPAVPGAELPNWATMIMELLCLGIFIFRFWRLSRFVPRDALLHDRKNIVVMLTVAVTFVDMIVYVGMFNSDASDSAIRVSRILRPLFLVNMNESRQIRRAFRNIRNTIPDILSVLVLFFFSIALFSLMAFKLFEKRDLEYRTNEPYFQNYWDSYWDLYVLVTTANSPDAMMPAYDLNGWYALFFISYIVVNTYIFMNLFLAVIYNSYKTHLQQEIETAVNEKHRKLDKAFDLLKNETVDSEPCVLLQKWRALLQVISTSISCDKTMLLWHVLCDNETEDGITAKGFSRVAGALNVRLVVDSSDRNIFATKCPQCFNSKASKLLIIAVNHIIFVYVFDVLILANAVCIALDLEQTEWFFLPVFMIEIGLRIYAVGPLEYFSFDRLWNWFDFLIITAAFIATIIEASLDERKLELTRSGFKSNTFLAEYLLMNRIPLLSRPTSTHGVKTWTKNKSFFAVDSFPREALDVLLVLRCLRLVKIVGNIERFRIVVMTIVNITPSLLTYAGVLMMVYYCFAIVGMETFADKISFNQSDVTNCGNSKLDGSEFERMGYCQMNFNDVLHSIITLFVLMVVNQWHVITQGYVLLTSKAARLFFITFHLLVVILIMNIIVAFVLEVFILEYTIKNNEMENIIEEKIKEMRLRAEKSTTNRAQVSTERSPEAVENEPQPSHSGVITNFESNNELNYKLRVNKGHKNIEVLLQRMFEATQKEEASREENAQNIDHVTQLSSTL